MISNKTLNVLGGLLLVVALTVTCSDAHAKRPPLADKSAYAERLEVLCEQHAAAYCPKLSWADRKPSRVKDGEIGCGFTAAGYRACAITLWSRAAMASLDHEFAHYLTWVHDTDGDHGKFGHGPAFNHAVSVVRDHNHNGD